MRAPVGFFVGEISQALARQPSVSAPLFRSAGGVGEWLCEFDLPVSCSAPGARPGPAGMGACAVCAADIDNLRRSGEIAFAGSTWGAATVECRGTRSFSGEGTPSKASARKRAAAKSGTSRVIAWSMVRVRWCWNFRAGAGGALSAGGGPGCSVLLRSLTRSGHATTSPSSMRLSVLNKAETEGSCSSHDAHIESANRRPAKFRPVASATCCCKKAVFSAFHSPRFLKHA
mmetsp:Transcript_86660/g.250080  ORF Transcript_86660/g.250080 Transcript_86660/m.250080 type:complete len:230 (+) Transcript_86660:247-936(+)